MFVPARIRYGSKHKVLLTYLVTYLIIITLLFFVIGSFSYSNIIRAEKEKATIEMEQAVKKAVSVIETNMRDVVNIQTTFYTNSAISRLRKLEADFEPREYMRFLDMSNKLSSYTSSGQFLNRLTLYFHYNQLFIASNMLDSRPEIFYRLNFTNESGSYDQWRSEQLVHKKGEFFVTKDSPDGNVDLYYRLPILDQSKGVTVLARISLGKLIENLALTKPYNDSAIILTDGHGRILYSNREDAKALIDLAAKSPGSSNVIFEDTSYELCSEKLSLIDWTISFFVSAADIYADSRRAQTNLVYLYSLVLVSSIILSVIFSKKISDPVVSLLGLVDGWDSNMVPAGSTKKSKNESFIAKNLYYVLRRVSDMFNEYEQLESRIHEYRDTSRGIFFNRLLKGEVISVDEVKMLEEDVILDFSHYTVAVARIISSNEDKSNDIAMFAVSEAFAGMQEKGVYFCKTAFDRFSVIICSNKAPDQSEITNVIESALKKLNFDSLISLRWGIGDTVTSYDQIFASYRNAEYALYNHDVLDSQVIVWYTSADKQRNRLMYSFDDAQRLYTLISNGDAEATVQTIKELVDKNMEVLEASRGQRNRFISMLSETILLSVSKFSNPDSQLEREIERILSQMKKADSINAIIDYVSLAVEKLCTSIVSRKKNSYQRLIENIIAFIDENYDDPNLSLISIAQSMRLTESYISSFFKQYQGTNIHSYIEKKRMEKAAALLKGTDLTATEIGDRIGYNNINTFYKAFKRYYGVTPKEYRTY